MQMDGLLAVVAINILDGTHQPPNMGISIDPMEAKVMEVDK